MYRRKYKKSRKIKVFCLFLEEKGLHFLQRYAIVNTMNIERLEEWAKEVHSFYMYAGVDPAEHKTGGFYQR